jgi:hypothetical protein
MACNLCNLCNLEIPTKKLSYVIPVIYVICVILGFLNFIGPRNSCNLCNLCNFGIWLSSFSRIGPAYKWHVTLPPSSGAPLPGSIHIQRSCNSQPGNGCSCPSPGCSRGCGRPGQCSSAVQFSAVCRGFHMSAWSTVPARGSQ